MTPSTRPERLPFTGDDEADRLLAQDPLALLIGFALALAAGAWMVFDARRDDVYHDDPENLWRMVLRRQHGRVAWIANAPDDLSMN